MTRDCDNRELNFSYKSREDAQAMIGFGKTVIRVFKAIQAGVLIFLPSYTVLNKIKKVWKQNKLLRDM